MSSAVAFANPGQMFQMMSDANEIIAGMTPSGAIDALKASSTEYMVEFSAISEEIRNAIASGATAAEAFASYAASGALSAMGAATVAGYTTAELTLIAAGGGALTTAGILSLAPPVLIAASIVALGWSLGELAYQANPEIWEKMYAKTKEFLWEGKDTAPAVVDPDGRVYVNKSIVTALSEALEELAAPIKPNATGYAVPDSEMAPYIPGTIPVMEMSALALPTGNDSFYVLEFSHPIKVAIDVSSRYGLGVIMASETPFQWRYRWNYVDEFTEWVQCHIYGHTPAGHLSYGEIYNIPGAQGLPLPVQTYRVNRPSSWGPPENTAFINKTIDCIVDSYHETLQQIEGLEIYTGNPAEPQEVEVFKVDSRTGEISTIPFIEIKLPPVTQIGGSLVPLNPGVTPSPGVTPNPNIPNTYDEIAPYIGTTTLPTQYPDFYPMVIPPVADRTAPLPTPVPTTEAAISPLVDASAQVLVESIALPPPPPPPPLSYGESPSIRFPPIEFPSIIPSAGSGFIHVYNPEPAELISFGRWLWVTYGDASIQKLWNNPFDGVIGALELYATPATNGEDNIRSGFLTCPTTAALVRQRYTSIDCGSIVVPEYYSNYLDYSPYTKIHAYLPFVGIVELNTDDIIGHGVNITYHIDAYNGSCIAQITVAKNGYNNTVYQFSGNCAVDLPMAGGSQAAIRAGLISAAATGITSVVGGIASAVFGNIGGGINTAVSGIGSAVSHAVSQKSSVQHSGSFGASYGAMGIKKPYLIVYRPVQKVVYNYNEEYGYPAHTRVIIGRCKGYLRVREVHVIAPTASDEEQKLIEQTLKEGVFVS